MASLLALGLMSGTSLDGVDVALIETDGEEIKRLGPTGYRAYSDEDRALLRTALAAASVLTDRNGRPGALTEAEGMVTRVHALAVQAFLSAHSLKPADIAVIGFHGQTVLHRPRERLTAQIGDGKALARETKIKVVHDFRAADVAAGGEGAPLVPVYHRALARRLDLPRPIAVINIGGVANVSFLDGEAEPIAFDTGPGNAPIDDLVRARTGMSHDRDGKLAAAGKVHEDIVAKSLSDSYFSRRPPKSLDRAAFADLPLEKLSTEDAAATATAIVAASIARAADHLPKRPATWIVAGGGARNPTLLSMLRTRLRTPVRIADEVGWSADAMEAQAFAFLAVRSLRGLPLTFPSTTGVSRPMPGGVIAAP
ncbi:MAG TPA: anhydro-N-acetylmuramic acid kinase [Xanthobacteraceae bacterium]|nr:anhydro-N-acetylmuramic acid kinase [Xanthobacteraceae bacterium]